MSFLNAHEINVTAINAGLLSTAEVVDENVALLDVFSASKAVSGWASESFGSLEALSGFSHRFGYASEAFSLIDALSSFKTAPGWASESFGPLEALSGFSHRFGYASEAFSPIDVLGATGNLAALTVDFLPEPISGLNVSGVNSEELNARAHPRDIWEQASFSIAAGAIVSEPLTAILDFNTAIQWVFGYKVEALPLEDINTTPLIFFEGVMFAVNMTDMQTGYPCRSGFAKITNTTRYGSIRS